VSVTWLLTRTDLGRRWGSWVVLGVLAGASVGLACAGIAGARRTERAVPHYAAVSHIPDAAVLPNDPAFDDAVRAAMAALPEVSGVYPFMVPFLLEVAAPEGMTAPLLPTTPEGMKVWNSPFVAGRPPDPARADEVAVNEQARDQFGLTVGSTMTLVQHPPPPDFAFPAPPGAARPIVLTLRVVGVMDGAGSDGPDETISSAFYNTYREQLVGTVNAMVDLRRGAADLDAFREDVDRLMGKPINVENADDLFGVRQLDNVSNVETKGLVLFALAVLLGTGVLVGQALVRAVSAGAAHLFTWQALGVDHRQAVNAIAAPAALSAAVAAVTTVAVAILASPRFPIALTRQFELDVGFHADWVVLVPGAFGVALAVAVTAWISAEVRVRRDRVVAAHRSTYQVPALGLTPAMTVGSRLATDPGRGSRSVPVRSALVGAIAGVLGVVACLTFRSGLSDTVARPSRSGVVWSQTFAKAGLLTDDEVGAVAGDPAVAASVRATWARAVRVNGMATPMFGVSAGHGAMRLAVLAGRAPEREDEIAFAPTTMDRLGVHIGDRVTVGESPGRPMVVVGRALLPATSHTDYDQSAWITGKALEAVVPPNANDSGDFFEDFLLLEWKPSTNVGAAESRMNQIAAKDTSIYYTAPAELPAAVRTLATLRSVPVALSIFFALLAIATVAHALLTTMQRRRTDLAILRSLGFTTRDTRVAITWQATMLAVVGVVIGVPAGIVVGRALWKQLAESYPVAYVPPLALVAVVLIGPAAVLIANALALGPARRATRPQPAQVLRTE
jgi:hypothetical protein